MSNVLVSIRQFLSELRRRNVYQVAVAYLAAGFVVVELADIAAGTFDLPGWFGPMVWVVVGLGSPIAIILAWALEVTPEGVRVEEPEASEETAPSPGGVSLTSTGLIVGLLALAIGLQLYPRVVSSGEEAGRQATAPDTAQVEEHSIAVLPFANLSGTEKARPIVRGLHDDLLTRLSNVSDLKVISRTSVERYRNTDLPLPAIADSLGVRWIVEGGVQRSKNKIQVNAQLIDPRSDVHRWADSYQRDLSAKGLFAIQGEIAGAIADALKAKLTPSEQERIAGAPTENLQAYRLYVKGRQLLNQRTETSVRQARTSFKRALRSDSTYALAWSGLADAWGLMPFQTTGSSPGLGDTLQAVIPEAEAAARRALEIAPNLAEAHASMGYVYLLKQEGPRSLYHLRQAVELKPSYAQAHHWLGGLQMMLGRAESALEHYILTIDLNPLNRSVWDELIRAQVANGKYEEALGTIQDATQRHPNASSWESWKIFVFAQWGRWEKFREALQQSQSEIEIPDASRLRAQVWSDAAAGDTASARKHLASLRGLAEAQSIPVAEAYVALGKEDAALSALRSTERTGGSIVLSERLRYSRLLDPLRDDSRFEAVIRELNRAWGLNADGTIPEELESATTAGFESDA